MWKYSGGGPEMEDVILISVTLSSDNNGVYSKSNAKTKFIF